MLIVTATADQRRRHLLTSSPVRQSFKKRRIQLPRHSDFPGPFRETEQEESNPLATTTN